MPYVRAYAIELAQHYFPKRADTAAYIAPIAHAFSVDLVIAPILHRTHHLWRYDYDGLDVVSQFYKFSTPSKGYYHLSYGKLPSPNPESVREGCQRLGVDLGEHVSILFDTYQVEGARARVAARILEALAGLAFDYEQNQEYGFMQTEVKQQLRKMQGKGRFRYLRRGREWMLLGSSAGKETVDIRQFPVNNLFGYRIEIQNIKVRVTLAKAEVELAKAKALSLLESESSIIWRVKQINSFYENFHKTHRYVNSFNWTGLDHWIAERVEKAARNSEQKRDWHVYQANKHKYAAVNQPRRGNFFWNIRELNCDYINIWNPYRWPAPVEDIV